MAKELVISATPHETRVAIVEEGQLCEIYVEREKEFSLVGSIYKGRVTRVLPGMQSAFVDIGLDGDAFLYVTDFLEDVEEVDHIVSTVEEKVQKMEQQGGEVFASSGGAPVLVEPPEVTATGGIASQAEAGSAQSSRPTRSGHDPQRDFGRGGRDRGGRWRRRGGRNRRDHRRDLPPSKYVLRPEDEPADHDEPPLILPGESLAKYKDRVATPTLDVSAAEAGDSAAPAEAPTVFHPEEPLSSDTPGAAGQGSGVAQPEQELGGAVSGEWLVPSRAEPALEPTPEGFEPTPEDAQTFTSEDLQLTPEEAASVVEQMADLHADDETQIEGAEGAAERDVEVEGADDSSVGEEELAETELTESTSGVAPAEAAPEPPPAVEPDDRTARVREDYRARMQRPARRGGRRRGHPHRVPHRHVPRRPLPSIAELLKPGQEIIVQIAKEPLGKKGARITSHVALPGRFLVYMPTLDHIGVSRKINSAEERARLRRTVLEAKGNMSGGFIVRTAAEGASAYEVRSDVEFLGRTWRDMLARAEQRKAPTLLHRDLNLVERVLRDQLSTDYTAVWVDNEEEYAKVAEFVGRFQPGLVGRVKLYSKDTPIFEEFGIQQEIDKALRPKVWLKSGGYIVINHTEALVAIDVNTGKFVGRGSTRLEDTIVRTNLEAVKEIVRQIRLRDLGGIIVLDFIDMEERRNRQKVMQALEEALRTDRAPFKVLSFNEFGLVTITRKRTKQALEKVLCQPCPYCTGSGMVKSVPTICYEIQAEARKMAAELDSPTITLRVHPEIAKALKTRDSVLVEELEQWTHKSIIIQADPSLHWEQYDIH